MKSLRDNPYQDDLDWVEELQSTSYGLSDWEVSFLEGVAEQLRRRRPMTTSQRDKAEEIESGERHY